MTQSATTTAAVVAVVEIAPSEWPRWARRSCMHIFESERALRSEGSDDQRAMSTDLTAWLLTVGGAVLCVSTSGVLALSKAASPQVARKLLHTGESSCLRLADGSNCLPLNHQQGSGADVQAQAWSTCCAGRCTQPSRMLAGCAHQYQRLPLCIIFVWASVQSLVSSPSWAPRCAQNLLKACSLCHSRLVVISAVPQHAAAASGM